MNNPKHKHLHAVEREFSAAFRSPDAFPIFTLEANPAVSMEAFACVYADFRAALKGKHAAEDERESIRQERDTARRKLRNAQWIICVLWVVTVVLIVKWFLN